MREEKLSALVLGSFEHALCRPLLHDAPLIQKNHFLRQAQGLRRRVGGKYQRAGVGLQVAQQGSFDQVRALDIRG